MAGELTYEEAVAFLDAPEATESATATSATSRLLSPEEAVSFLSQEKMPAKPGAFKSLVAGGLEGLAGVADMAKLGLAALDPGQTFIQDPRSSVGAGLRGMAQQLVPPEAQGRGTWYGEDLPRAAGRMAPGLAASVAMPAAGLGQLAAPASGAYWASQAGPDAFFSTLEGTDGDTDAALKALVGNSALAQLEQLGLGGQFTRIGKKLAGEAGERAVSKLALMAGLGGGTLKEVGTEVVQQLGSDLLTLGLTPAEVDLLDGVIATATDPTIWTLGVLGSAAEAAVDVAKGGAAPSEKIPDISGATQGQPSPSTPASMEATQAQPEAPVGQAEPVALPEATVVAQEPETAQVSIPGQVSEPAAPGAHIAATSPPQTEAAQEPAASEEVQEPKPDAEPEEGDILMHAGLPPLRGTDRMSLSADASKRALKKGAKAIHEGLIKTHGGKPEAAALMEERARGQVEIQASRARSATKAVKRAIYRHNKGKATADKITNKRLMAAMTDPNALAALPDSVRPQVEKMRQLSDDLSRTIVDEGMTGQTMSEVIEGRMGEYLRRAYKAHNDPKWAERVPQDVRNRLESLLVSWSAPLDKGTEKALQSKAFEEGRPKTMEQREAHFELQSRRRLQGKPVDDIRAEMLAMLHDAQRVAENPWAAFAKSKLKRQDVSLFKARKGLPVEMREYLGEEKNPYTAYTNTIIKQASFVATHRKFKEMRAEGMGRWLHEKPTVKDGVNYTERVSVAGNPRLAPLVGDADLYTTKEIRKALFEADKTMANPWWRGLMIANTVLKATKTIYQPWAVSKQAMSQITALTRNGHALFATRNANMIRKVMYSGQPKYVAMREEMMAHQLLDTSVAAAEFKDVQETMANRKLNEPWSTAVKVNDMLAGLYTQPDNFSKTASYWSEKRAYLKAGLDEKTAQLTAANNTKNLYPTYSRIVPWVNAARKQPFFGTFMAFKSEQVRTQIENLRLIGKELKSDNPAIKRKAVKRIASTIVGYSMAPIGAMTANMLNGVDSEEDERRRERVSEYDRERDLIWTGDKEYFDISDIDDGAWVTDPMLRIAAGADAEEVIAELVRENFGPFKELSLVSQSIAEWAWGRTKYGTPIENRWEWFKQNVTPSGWKKPSLGEAMGLRIKSIP